MESFRTWLPTHLFATAVVFVVGSILRRHIGRKSPSRRLHGKFVFWWALGGYFVGGLLFWNTDEEVETFEATGTALFGMLAGWLIGTLHGAIVLLIRRFRQVKQPVARASGW
jgi:hypothetical protein